MKDYIVSLKILITQQEHHILKNSRRAELII